MDLEKKIYYKFISKLNNSEYVGVEIELPILNLYKPFKIEMNIIQQLFDTLIKLNFEVISKDNDNNIIAIKNIENGDTISLEYSCNTIELSLNKEKSIFNLEKKFKKYYALINNFFKNYNYKIGDCGINPNYKVIDKASLNQDRYKIIEKMLLTKKNRLYSEFCAYCCSIQTHINVGQNNLINVLNCFTLIEDIKDNIFANSYMKETNMYNSRKFLWEKSNFKPKNIGKNKIYKDITDLINDYKKRNLFFVERNNKYMLLKNKISLQKYFKEEKILVNDGDKEFFIEPKEEDFENFRSYKSLELSKYGTIEIRTDCMQKIDRIFMLVAFNVGISLSANEILSCLNKGNILTEKDLIIFSINGLKKRAKKEESYLEEL